MGLLRLSVCISGVYATFLLWAIAQERLSKPFPSIYDKAYPASHSHQPGGDKLPSTLFLNFAQALASASFAAIYLTLGSWRNGRLRLKGIRGVLGLSQLRTTTPTTAVEKAKVETMAYGTNGTAQAGTNGSAKHDSATNGVTDKGDEKQGRLDVAPSTVSWTKTLPFLLFQVSLFQTTAGPIGFSALRHISYPTMVLGKSCKLIPVLLLNVVLYRRRFSPHKYLVVALVTVGISMFMFFGPAKKKGGSDSAWGLVLLLVNLLIDGLTNSTQDQIFTKYPRFTGQQMMFMMSSFTILLLLPAMILPLPEHPMSLVHHLPYPLATRLLPFAHAPHISFAPPAVLSTTSFIVSHPSALAPLLAYALLGGLGQLFIFETIQHFGSLTLVMVTVTRKLFTMLLSVLVFDHSLTAGQWAGVAVVFGGIAVEAGYKRMEMLRRAKKD